MAPLLRPLARPLTRRYVYRRQMGTRSTAGARNPLAAADYATRGGPVPLAPSTRRLFPTPSSSSPTALITHDRFSGVENMQEDRHGSGREAGAGTGTSTSTGIGTTGNGTGTRHAHRWPSAWRVL